MNLNKYFIILISFFILPLSVLSQESMDSTGYPGDDFSLEGALELFKISTSPEDFERRINDQKNEVNNLDLDGDGYVDYIHITNKTLKDIHVLILSIYLSEKEIQDIAIVTIEKTGPEEAMLQIIGDKDVFGSEVIAEPINDTVYTDKEVLNQKTHPKKLIFLNVYGWPCVKHMYMPGYKPWVSTWRWRHYPAYWNPWRPVPYFMHRNRVYKYRTFFTIAPIFRIPAAQKLYKPHRRTTTVVSKRTTIVRKSSKQKVTKQKRVVRSRRN